MFFLCYMRLFLLTYAIMRNRSKARICHRHWVQNFLRCLTKFPIVFQGFRFPSQTEHYCRPCLSTLSPSFFWFRLSGIQSPPGYLCLFGHMHSGNRTAGSQQRAIRQVLWKTLPRDHSWIPEGGWPTGGLVSAADSGCALDRVYLVVVGKLVLARCDWVEIFCAEIRGERRDDKKVAASVCWWRNFVPRGIGAISITDGQSTEAVHQQSDMRAWQRDGRVQPPEVGKADRWLAGRYECREENQWAVKDGYRICAEAEEV